jgi:hypothetical protein
MLPAVGGLQEVLDRSFERATPFTRSLFEADRWDAEQVASFINAQRNMTIASVTGGGDPHAVVVIAACLDEQVHFTVAVGSLLHRCLRQRPSIAFSVCDPVR